MARTAAVLFGLGWTNRYKHDRQQLMVKLAAIKVKIKRQLEQVVKALDSGDIAVAKGYLEETVQGLPERSNKNPFRE